MLSSRVDRNIFPVKTSKKVTRKVPKQLKKTIVIRQFLLKLMPMSSTKSSVGLYQRGS